MKKVNEECVVTFKTKGRVIAQYYTENEDGLDLQMSVDPEFSEGEEPDLAMLLASTLMESLRATAPETEVKDDLNPKVYDGTD